MLNLTMTIALVGSMLVGGKKATEGRRLSPGRDVCDG